MGLDILLGHTPQSPSSVFTPGSERSTDPILPHRPTSSSSSNHEPPAFAVVFLDNQMPVMCGLDVVKELKMVHQRHDLFVVGVTGNATLEDQREFREAGADEVLTKPVRNDQLGVVLASASERWHNRFIMSR